MLLPAYLAYAFWRDRRAKGKRQQEQLSEQFKEALGYMKEILQAGTAFERTVSETAARMEGAYGEKSMLAEELKRIHRQVQIGVPVEEAFAEFAGRSGNEDVEGFAEVLRIAKRSGGGIGGVISYTEGVLQDKQETMRQIGTALHAREYEAGLLKIMPFGILGYFLLFLPEFLDPLYRLAVGKLIMSGLLAVYLGLCLALDRLCEISV